MNDTKIGIKRNQIGLLSVDTGDVVCFSLDDVIKIAASLNRGFANKKLTDTHSQSEDIDEFITENNGVLCGFHADGGYGMDEVCISTPDGNTYKGILIGAPTQDGPIRLLPSDMPSYEEKTKGRVDWQTAGKEYMELVKTLWD